MEGIIQAVNKNGIRISEKWYNATKECEKFVTPELKGCNVEITLLPESTLFTFIKKLSEPKKQESEIDMKFRAMAISYVKDLVISDDIEKHEMIEIADGLFHYIKTGEKVR